MVIDFPALFEQKGCLNIIGVMSGTSLDGLDLAYVSFRFEGQWKYELHCTETIAYSEEWVNELRSLVEQDVATLKSIDEEYTRLLGQCIQQFIATHNVSQVDAVSSHGHTAKHQPEKGITYQIGNRKELATILGIPVVCDFRKQDVALGGQGAPLVPVGDWELFSDFDACVNFGGFANVTFTHLDSPLAYDVGGFNLVFNRISRRLGKAYDKDGEIAHSGTLIPELYSSLEALEYYQLKPPKSLGVEWLEAQVYPLLDTWLETHSEAAVMHTYAKHISNQLARVLSDNNRILCTGGGAYHRVLLDFLKKQLKGNLHLPSVGIIEFKEAIIFGFLGVLRLLGHPNCFASVTGVSTDHCSGEVYFP